MVKDLSSDRYDVVLLAHEPPNCEHLGIRVLAAGLAEAGFRARLLPVGSPTRIEAVVAETLAAGPTLVGVSISDPLSAPLLLAFVRLLRQRGFAGHITAGGPLATLERTSLLAAHPALDSVVRHAGEAVIVDLARALREGAPLDGIGGLSTRSGDGPGNPAAFAPSRLWPLRAPQPPTLLGIPKADVAASRGCSGACAYCGVSALERELSHERRLLGLSAVHTHGRILRPMDDLANEVAALYHERSVRIVQLVDDNLLGSDARAANAWLEELEAALRRRQVGQLSWRLMIEPSAVSDQVADTMARLGVLTALVGIESLTPQGKSALGRRGTSGDDLACLHRLARRGISPILNLLAVRPDGTLADTRAELAGLDQLDNFAWEVVPLAVWPGTTLARQLAEKGQLVGQGAGLSWRPREPELERFAFALNRLRTGGLAWITRLPGAVDVLFALRTAHRLGLPGADRALIDQAQVLLAQAQRVRRGILDQALALATAPLSTSEFGQAVEALQQRSATLLGPFDERFALLLDDVSWPDAHAVATRPARLLVSPWLAHGLLMAMAAGCSGAGLRAHPKDSAIPDTVIADTLRADLAVVDASGEAPGIVLPDAPAVDTRSPAPGSCAADGGWSGAVDGLCDVTGLEQAVKRGTSSMSCSQYSWLPSGEGYAVVIDCEGRVVELLSPYQRTPLLTGAARQAWLDSLANDRWPCFAGQSVQFTCMICLFP
jgi:anaerobic magnesium-protoporphyrin IX monomethyl ester cyclase